MTTPGNTDRLYGWTEIADFLGEYPEFIRPLVRALDIPVWSPSGDRDNDIVSSRRLLEKWLRKRAFAGVPR